MRQPQSIISELTERLQAEDAGNLVHELQKERGMTAGFLGSKGTKFADKILIQRQQVDARLEEFKRFIDSLTLPLFRMLAT